MALCRPASTRPLPIPRTKLGLRNCERGAVDATVEENLDVVLLSCLAALRAVAAIRRLLAIDIILLSVVVVYVIG